MLLDPQRRVPSARRRGRSVSAASPAVARLSSRRAPARNTGPSPRSARCNRQSQGNFDGMCKRHFNQLNNPKPPPPEEPPIQRAGTSVYEDIIPASVAWKIPKKRGGAAASSGEQQQLPHHQQQMVAVGGGAMLDHHGFAAPPSAHGARGSGSSSSRRRPHHCRGEPRGGHAHYRSSPQVCPPRGRLASQAGTRGSWCASTCLDLNPARHLGETA